MTLVNRASLREDLPLLEHIDRRIDRLQSKSVARVLDRLALPAPQDHEYFVTSDFGYLVMLSPLGCALRITSNYICPPIKHDRIIQPLKRFFFEEHRVEIFPGLELKSSMATVMRLQLLLKNSRIQFNDDWPRNCAVIPAKALKSIFNYSVVCDIGACSDQRHHDDEKRPVRVAANDNMPTQDKAYKHLRAAFAGNDMAAAWKLCTENKAQGILKSDWADVPKSAPDAIIAAAAKYSPRIAHLAG
ncbi:MAG TPA: hypothetical protein VGD95_01420 [Micavibrio sp.]